jgi:hypothetical protein
MSNGKTTIYVELLDEGVDCWRPVVAIRLGARVFQIANDEVVPHLEHWAFRPGTVVECVEKTFESGERGLVAIRACEPPPHS